MDLQIGTLFDTPFEKGCKALTLPDASGEFTALDSGGEECDYTVSMVVGLTLCGYSMAHAMVGKTATETLLMGAVGSVPCCQQCADFYRRLQGE